MKNSKSVSYIKEAITLLLEEGLEALDSGQKGTLYAIRYTPDSKKGMGIKATNPELWEKMGELLPRKSDKSEDAIDFSDMQLS